MVNVPDLAIIGSGPAGLFAAYQLSRLSPGLSIQILANDPNPRSSALAKPPRARDSPVTDKGLGGSGRFADKLYFDSAGGWLESQAPEYARALMAYSAEIFERFGGLSERKAFALDRNIPPMPGLDYKLYKKLVPVTFIEYRKLILNIVRKLKENGVQIKYSPSVGRIARTSSGYNIQSEKGSLFRSKNVLIATGRSSASWFVQQAASLGLRVEPGRPYFGVRVEARTKSVVGLRSWGHDPKLKLKSFVRTSSDTKTHCVCFAGHVISCACDNMVLVDGTTFDRPSSNTSFNVLTRIPQTLSVKRCRYIAQSILRTGDGKPIVQTMGDFTRGIPSTAKKIKSNHVEATLKEATPGELTRHLPIDAVTNIIHFLAQIMQTIPGTARGENLVYAPVFEWFSPKVLINKSSGKTGVPGLYVAGDVAGVSQGVVMAAASGLWTGIKLAELI
jgi:uncharacterized FAD-dependent dehydrogenase